LIRKMIDTSADW